MHAAALAAAPPPTEEDAAAAQTMVELITANLTTAFGGAVSAMTNGVFDGVKPQLIKIFADDALLRDAVLLGFTEVFRVLAADPATMIAFREALGKRINVLVATRVSDPVLRDIVVANRVLQTSVTDYAENQMRIFRAIHAKTPTHAADVANAAKLDLENGNSRATAALIQPAATQMRKRNLSKQIIDDLAGTKRNIDLFLKDMDEAVKQRPPALRPSESRERRESQE